MTSRHLQDMIDACRPGHDDLDQAEFNELATELSRDPKLQRLFERSQALDATIRSSFQAVTPPPGLAERLLASLESVPVENGEAAPASAEVEACVEPARRASRRSIAIWAGVASLSAVVAAIAFWLQIPPPFSASSEREIAERVDHWNASLDETDWQASTNIPSKEFPTWEHLDLHSVSGWQWVSKRKIVCYDFATDAGAVRLFVMNPTGPLTLPNRPPGGYPSPDGWHVGAWQANGRVYFLAVYADRDSKDLYDRVVASPFNPA